MPDFLGRGAAEAPLRLSRQKRPAIIAHNVDYAKTPYFHVAHARDLQGWDRALYRAFEILPGALAWGSLLGTAILSATNPRLAAYFIILFDFYWLLKTVYLSAHHRHNWKRLRHNMAVDWPRMLEGVKHEHLYHLILLPFYREGREVVEQSIRALARARYDLRRFIVVLAAEERAGPAARELAEDMRRKYGARFGHFLVTVHPDGLPGEIRGKGPNITYAAQEAQRAVLEAHGIPFEDVIVSAFDIDTVVHPHYFACLSWHFMTTEDRLRASFQPVPLYNNNIWHAPAVSRVAALSSTFWQMIQQERPEKLTTFSSHAVSFAALARVGFWQKNMISDDSRIFWNLYLAHDGNYRVVPISFPVSMDANLTPSLWRTMVNIYRQHRRWMWGVENIPYMLFGFVKNKRIPLKEKIRHSIVQIEGFWSLATNPLFILLLGWLPLLLGGEAFRDTVLSYNLPLFTRNLMILAMGGLVLSAIVAFTLIPPLPPDLQKRKAWHYTIMALQWTLVPVTIVVFGAIPGLDAQTRLMLGRYLGAFWVTPKHRVAAAPPLAHETA